MSLEIRLPFLPYPDKPLLFEDPSLTHQSFSQECDFNAVMAQWERTGTLPNSNPSAPSYEDVSDLVDYQQSVEIVAAAWDSFSALPSRVRERFGNDPAALIQFLQDPANRSEASSLGLLSEGSTKSPSKGSVVDPEEPPQGAS